MFHQTQSGSVWQASHVSQGHPQMLETADRQTFSRAAGAGGFDARDIHVPEIQSPLSSDTPRYYGSVLLGNEQHYATLPEYRSAGHFHRFNVNQPHQPMDPQAQYRRPFPNPREVLYPLAREPNRPFSAYKGDPSFIWYPISTVSGPPVNQGNLAFVPVSTRNPMFYRRMSEDGQNLGEFQICPRGSEIDPRTAGHDLSSLNIHPRQEPHSYRGPGVTLTRPLAPRSHEIETSKRGVDQVLSSGLQSEALKAIIKSNNTSLTPTESSQHTFNRWMDPTPKRKRRKFSDAEKERMKQVRKHGACIECKSKKRKCLHVPILSSDRPSPQSPDTEDNEPVTPDSLIAPSPINFSPEVDFFGKFVDLEPQGMMTDT